MPEVKTIVFLCPHHAAKSVIAEAYWNRLAAQRGVPIQATSAGTEPAAVVSPAVVAALRAEGLDVSEHRPRRVTSEELRSAWRVVSLGCTRDELGVPDLTMEDWGDVPATSEAMAASQAAIAAHIHALMDAVTANSSRA
jgi:protein-tyrosine-phosphatase